MSKPANILVVDDQPANLYLLLEILLRQGYRVRPVKDGNLALAAAQLAPPDLVLLDVKMPAPNGFAVCQALKADARTRDIPVVFLTVLDDAIDKVRGFELGGVDYITKPFEATELLARVENQLRLRSLQQRLIEQEQFLRSIYNDIEAAISVIEISASGEFWVTEVNETFLRMSGLERHQLEGSQLSRFLPPEIIERHHQRCVETGCPITAEEPVVLNGEITWWLSTHTPVHNVQGKIERLIGTSLNITGRKQAEMQLAERTRELSEALEDLRETQSKLVESAKMAALGKLVAGVAHEINTPLGTAITAASTLENELHQLSALVGPQNLLLPNRAQQAPQEPLLQEPLLQEPLLQEPLLQEPLQESLDVLQECSQLVLGNLNRAGELVQSFKQVAVDQTSLQTRTFLMVQYLREIVVSLKPQLKQTPHAIAIAGEDFWVHSYPGGLSQIISNLILNSLRHAFPPSQAGQITISAHQREEQCILLYQDNGTGIPEAHLDKIFEPFFTTARHQGGSGLGLHLVYNLVTQQLQGHISVCSEVGQGTTFEIAIPRQIQLTPSASSAPSASPASSASSAQG